MFSGTYSMVFPDIGCIPLTYNGYSPASGWTTVRQEPGLTELKEDKAKIPKINTQNMVYIIYTKTY